MKKITITNSKGIGVLTRGADGRLDIAINGKGNTSAYYTDAQVDAIVVRAVAAGDKVERR